MMTILQRNFQISALIILLLSGCASYKINTTEFIACDEINPEKHEALHHWLYHVIPRHRLQIRWYDLGHWCTWTLFGNDDDGIFGEEPTAAYRPQQRISCGKAVRWWCRNPLHNFCFYVIGSAHRENSEITLLKMTKSNVECCHYCPCATTNFAGDDTSFFLALHGGKPFISLRLRYSPTHTGDFYLGWRARGAFGIKCIPFHVHQGDNGHNGHMQPCP